MHLVLIFAASVGRGVDVYRDLVRLNPEKVLLAETFRQVGYHTFGTGKWHNCRTSFARSFASGANIFFGGMSDHDQVPLHDFDPTGQYPDEKKYMGDGFSIDLFSGAAIDFLNTYKEDDPFFLYLAFTAPHDPRTPPAEYAYDPESIALPPNFMDEHPFDNGDMRLRDEVLADLSAHGARDTATHRRLLRYDIAMDARSSISRTRGRVARPITRS
ncbi:MAG: sulfatase-like hydrolase/transferase [Candidatus Latescibacterota bacterium]